MPSTAAEAASPSPKCSGTHAPEAYEGRRMNSCTCRTPPAVTTTFVPRTVRRSAHAPGSACDVREAPLPFIPPHERRLLVGVVAEAVDAHAVLTEKLREREENARHEVAGRRHEIQTAVVVEVREVGPPLHVRVRGAVHPGSLGRVVEENPIHVSIQRVRLSGEVDRKSTRLNSS